MPDLPEDKAIALGSQLVSELILLSVASAAAFNEYLKHKDREAEKNLEADQFFNDTAEELDEINLRVQSLSKEIKDIKAVINQVKI